MQNRFKKLGNQGLGGVKNGFETLKSVYLDEMSSDKQPRTRFNTLREPAFDIRSMIVPETRRHIKLRKKQARTETAMTTERDEGSMSETLNFPERIKS